MGMATLVPLPEGEEDKKYKKFLKKEMWEETWVDHFTSICLGFFVLPFLYFIVRTTIIIVTHPFSVTDGMALLYIALITGIYYILIKNTVLVFEPILSDILFTLFGLTIFIGAYFFINKLPETLPLPVVQFWEMYIPPTE